MRGSFVKVHFRHKVISGLMAFIVAMGPVGTSCAQSVVPMPAPGNMVALSEAFAPPLLKGIKVYRRDPFRFDFILDTGEAVESAQQLKDDSNRLIKYFLASLTVPEKDLWVNLSPYEKDRIVPEAFGQTEMGRDLLAQDYILKQVTASVIYPEGKVGKEFWDKVYAEALKRYGTTNIPVDTFNKVWIIPEKATVYENKDAALVVESRLKVMLESDYSAMSNNALPNEAAMKAKASRDAGQTLSAHEMAKDILRDVVIPILEKEVNEGRNFAPLRQVYHSLILATWYKRKVRESILGLAYVDRQKTAGIDITDKNEKEKIWQKYVEAFRKGAYNLIKEEYDPATQEMFPRKYFSGGTDLAMGEVFTTIDRAELKDRDVKNLQVVQMNGALLANEGNGNGVEPVVLGVKPEARVYLTTATGRNRDVIDLIRNSDFVTRTGVDLREGTPVVVDVGIGFPPITTIEMKNNLQKLNENIRFIGADLPDSTAQAQLTFRSGSRMFNALRAIAQEVFTANISEIIFIATPAGVEEYAGVSDIVIKTETMLGWGYQDIMAPNIIAQVKQRERTASAHERREYTDLFIDLFKYVSERMDINWLSEHIDWKNDLDGVLEKEPVQNLLMANGIEFLETNELSSIIENVADIVTASHVTDHLNENQRKKFIPKMMQILKEKGVLLVKNEYSRYDVSKIDVYQKQAEELNYLGSVLSDTQTRLVFSEEDFFSFVKKAGSDMPVLIGENPAYLFRDSSKTKNGGSDKSMLSVFRRVFRIPLLCFEGFIEVFRAFFIDPIIWMYQDAKARAMWEEIRNLEKKGIKSDIKLLPNSQVARLRNYVEIFEGIKLDIVAGYSDIPKFIRSRNETFPMKGGILLVDGRQWLILRDILQLNMESITKRLSEIAAVRSTGSIWENGYSLPLWDALTNAVVHGNQSAKGAPLVVTWDLSDKKGVFRFYDCGFGGDLKDYSRPSRWSQVNDLSGEGKGLEVMRSVFDAVTHERIPSNGGNIGAVVTLVRNNWKKAPGHFNPFTGKAEIDPAQARRIDSSMHTTPGGIDFNPSRMNMIAQNSDEAVKFNIDSAMLERMQNASGVAPVIMNILPLESLQHFLSMPQSSAQFKAG